MYNTHSATHTHLNTRSTSPDIYAGCTDRQYAEVPAESIPLQSCCLWFMASASLPFIYILDVYSSHTHSHPPTILTTHSAHSSTHATNTFTYTQTYVPLPFPPGVRAPDQPCSLRCLLCPTGVPLPTHSGSCRLSAGRVFYLFSVIDMQHLSCL